MLSFFSLLDSLFTSNLFNFSITLESDISILSSKNCILLSFYFISISMSDVVSPILITASLKTLL